MASTQPAPELTMGQRVKFWRTRRGMTQLVLAGLIGKSESWVRKVEADGHIIDKYSVILDLARVLRIRNLSDLTGGAYVALTADDTPEHESVPAIRSALYTPASLLGATVDEPMTPALIDQHVTEAWRIYEHVEARYKVVGRMLPRLIAEAHAAAQAYPDAARSLISVYHLLQVFLRRVGEPTLSQIAADRSMALADQIGDPELIAASAWNVCSILTNVGQVEESADLAMSTIDAYAPGDDATPGHLAAVGALHLAAVIASVRAGIPRGWDLLDRADGIAAQLGGDTNLWRTSFGPTNIAMHRVHLASEEGDAGEALRLADRVKDNPALPLERRTRYMIEVLHAHRRKKDDHGVLLTAQRIQAISPEEMRWHPLVRAAASDLMTRMRETIREDVEKFAAHVGVLT
jgi:transcriptional regulator with XRE-family HTH domain